MSTMSTIAAIAPSSAPSATTATTTTTTTTDAAAAPAAALTTHLDALLTRYLRLLDRRERLAARARAHLRAGHLALAQAQFRSANRAGVRFGPDLYDDKMTATLRLDFDVDVDGVAEDGAGGGGAAEDAAANQVVIGKGTGTSTGTGMSTGTSTGTGNLLPWSLSARVLPTRTGASGRRKVRVGAEAEGGEGDGDELADAGTVAGGEESNRAKKGGQLVTPPASRDATPVVTDEGRKGDGAPEMSLDGKLASISLNSVTASEGASTKVSTDNKADATEADEDDLPPDPIRQFGILVPQALRDAQASFRKSMLGDGHETSEGGDDGRAGEGGGADGGGWIEVVVLEAQMRAVEVEVRRTRKRLRKVGGP